MREAIYIHIGRMALRFGHWNYERAFQRRDAASLRRRQKTARSNTNITRVGR